MTSESVFVFKEMPIIIINMNTIDVLGVDMVNGIDKHWSRYAKCFPVWKKNYC